MSKKQEELLEKKFQVALNTFVREKWEEIPEEISVSMKSLKAWGFDLIAGRRQGKETFFVSETAKGRKAGDVYEEDGEKFEIHEILEKFPKGGKLLIRVGLEERRGVIHAFYSESGEDTPLFTLPAGELLVAYFKKRRFFNLMAAFHSSGLTTEFIQSNGTEGRAVDYDQLPPKMRRILRESSELIRKQTRTGRFTLVFFGYNKEKKERYVATYLLPTIYLFDVDIAEKLNQLLASLT